jgi:hypothetical protein
MGFLTSHRDSFTFFILPPSLQHNSELSMGIQYGCREKCSFEDTVDPSEVRSILLE